jgi:REP element-mobilizing transposase RayT
MSRWHNYYLDEHVHFCTYAVRAWTPLLDHQVVDCIYAQWTINSHRFDVKILGYVIMPEHIHMLIWSHKGRNIMRFLQRTLGQISKLAFPGVGRVWKERPHVFHSQRMVCLPKNLTTYIEIPYAEN